MKFGLIVLCCLLVIPFAYAINIGVVVEFPDSTKVSECISVPVNTDGYVVLEKTDLDILWSDAGMFGNALCKINDIGEEKSGTNCAWGNEYWNLMILENGDFSYLPVGLNAPGSCWNHDFNSFSGHYCAKEGDVLGFAHGSYNTRPTATSFDEVCIDPLIISDVKVKVDGSKETSADENGGTIHAGPGDLITLEIELENTAEIDANDIYVIGTLKNVDDGDDIESEDDKSSIDVDDKEDFTLEYHIPIEVDADDYTLEIEIEYEDEDGIEFKKILTYTVEIQKKSKDLLLAYNELSKSEAYPGEIVELELAMINIGDKDLDTIEILIKEPKLGILILDTLDLESGANQDDVKTTKIYSLEIPDNALLGMYTINVLVSYSGKVQTKEFPLKILEPISKTLQSAPPDLQTNIVQSPKKTPEKFVLTKEKTVPLVYNPPKKTDYTLYIVFGEIAFIVIGILFILLIRR